MHKKLKRTQKRSRDAEKWLFMWTTNKELVVCLIAYTRKLLRPKEQKYIHKTHNKKIEQEKNTI